MKRNLALTSLFIVSASLANAQVISVTGNVVSVAAPSSVKHEQFINDTNAQVFAERSNYLLPSAVEVDATANGLYNGAGDLSTSVLAAGQNVNTFLLHSDQTGDGEKGYSGSITFKHKILAVIATNDHLNDSDGVMGSLTTAYPTVAQSGGRHFELGNREYFEIDGNTLHFANRVTTRFDQVRIVTEAVPEPATMATLALGLMGIARHKRRR